MFVLKSTYNELAYAFDDLEADNTQLAQQNDYFRQILKDLRRRDVQARNPRTGRFEKINLEGVL